MNSLIDVISESVLPEITLLNSFIYLSWVTNFLFVYKFGYFKEINDKKINDLSFYVTTAYNIPLTSRGFHEYETYFYVEKYYMEWLPIIPPQNQGLEFNSRILGWQQT